MRTSIGSFVGRALVMCTIGASALALAQSTPVPPASQSAPPASTPTQDAVSARALNQPKVEAGSAAHDAQSAAAHRESTEIQRRATEAAEEQARAAWAQVAIGWAATAISLIALVLVYFTFNATRISASAASAAAEAAARSAVIAESSSWPVLEPRVTHAGFAYPHGSGPFPPPQVTFAWDNFGKSPAVVVSTQAELQLHRDLDGSPSIAAPPATNRGLIFAAESRHNDETLVKHRPLLDNEVAELHKDLRIFLMGKIVYDDVFGNRHTKGFCIKLFLNGTSAFRGGSRFNYYKRARVPESPQTDSNDEGAR